MCSECGRYHGTDRCLVCDHFFDCHDGGEPGKCMLTDCDCPVFVWGPGDGHVSARGATPEVSDD